MRQTDIDTAVLGVLRRFSKPSTAKEIADELNRLGLDVPLGEVKRALYVGLKNGQRSGDLHSTPLYCRVHPPARPSNESMDSTKTTGDETTLLRSREDDGLEYKSSLRWDLELGRVNKDLVKTAVRAVAGFLNRAGGALLIGVDDAGVPIGLEADYGSLKKKDSDGFELALRDGISRYLGDDAQASVALTFEVENGIEYAVARCNKHHEPVYLRHADKEELYVRCGNQTRRFDGAAAIRHIQKNWPPDYSGGLQPDRLKELVRDAVREAMPERLTRVAETPDKIPAWMRIRTRRAINLFLENLARGHKWERIFVVSPWVSEFKKDAASMSLRRFLQRAKEDGATIYLITRPPTDGWHQAAVDLFVESERANVAYLPELHVKLFTARTASGSFAMLGSANLTQQSLENREIGVLIKSQGAGKAILREFDSEASEIYRHPNRKLVCQANFRPTHRGD